MLPLRSRPSSEGVCLKNGHPAHVFTLKDRRKAAAVTNEIRREKRALFEQLRLNQEMDQMFAKDAARRERPAEKQRRWREQRQALDWNVHGRNGAGLVPGHVPRAQAWPRGAQKSWGGFHTFRHTCATTLFRSGLNAKQVQVWLGHHSPAFTLGTYVHFLDDDLPSADFELRLV